MSSLEPRRSRTPRRQREQRAFGLVVAGGSAALVAAVSLVLAFIGVVSFGLPFLAIVVAAVCYLLFRRTVSS
jgi:predicted MFS family arabinose efflux permease